MQTALQEQGRQARRASSVLARFSAADRSAALLGLADAIKSKTESLLAVNEDEVREHAAQGMSPALQDRLRLTPERVAAMADGIREIAEMPDVLGEQISNWSCANGLNVKQIRVPLGVVGVIYEARPNVTVDAAALCLKTGNCVLLRGSRQALHTNSWLVNEIRGVLSDYALPQDVVQLVDDLSRESVPQMAKMRDYIDVIIPRGGPGLIKAVVEQATVPVIETGAGNCHLFIDDSAPLEMAVAIAVNAKCSRPSVCNAIETILIHQSWAKRHFRRLAGKLVEQGVELRLCENLLPLYSPAKAATTADYASEFLDLTVAIRQVDSVDAAIEHINSYGTRHSEAIVTLDAEAARLFLQDVDAACVYHNASTRFTDGSALGLGAEIGISTQKLHARGPMGLRALTSSKYLMSGEGQTRR